MFKDRDKLPRTRYSAILNELPKPSPNLSAPENIPTTNIGEFDRRPVSFSNLHPLVSQMIWVELLKRTAK